MALTARPMNRRTGISLNGKWDFTPNGQRRTQIDVPDYWDARPGFAGVDHAVYEREITLPDETEWRDKRYILEFEAVNFIASVSIDGKPAGEHTGGWIPFSLDVTALVRPGQPCRLSVDVKGGCHPPIVDKDGNPLWPVGFFGHTNKWGVIFDVWLKACGAVSAADVFIRPSFREKKLSARYEIANPGKKQRSVRLVSRVTPVTGPEEPVLELTSAPVTIEPETTIVRALEAPWADPRLWSPGDPRLYWFDTEVVDAATGEVIDRRRDRFGFREIWTEGKRLMFNGRPFTILGANLVQHSEFFDNQRYHLLTRETWHRTIDRLFALNLRTVRFHMQPAPFFLLDTADERGLLIMDESPVYSRDYMQKVDIPTYLENARAWIGPWIRSRRNHPSIIVWNVENEMGHEDLACMSPDQIRTLVEAVRPHDDTRPVNCDGDPAAGSDMINLHYPEKYAETVSGSIYSWASLVRPDKPTGVGEFITHYGPHGHVNQWWQGTWVRGMRYVNFADIRPYRHDWALLRPDNPPCVRNLINSLSPVALFDREYDDLGIDPLLHHTYPQLVPGETVTRTLVLYNDDWSEETVEIEVLVKTSAVYQILYHYVGDHAPLQHVAARGGGYYTVPLGEHVTIPCSFTVPRIPEGLMDSIDVELIARKRGQVKFRETIRFSVRSKTFRDETSPEVHLGPASEPIGRA